MADFRSISGIPATARAPTGLFHNNNSSGAKNADGSSPNRDRTNNNTGGRGIGLTRSFHSMSSTINSTTAGTSGVAGSTGSAATTTPKNEVSKDEFLQLLVAQMKNQDPLNPADGTQFLTQLAQFSQLEQLTGMRSDLQSLTSELQTSVTAPAATTSTT